MKKLLFSGIFVLAIAAISVFKIDLGSQSSKLSLLSLANIEALANDETDATGKQGPEHSWTSNEEIHWEGDCLVTTYSSHIGCLNIGGECYPGVTTIRHRDCP